MKRLTKNIVEGYIVEASKDEFLYRQDSGSWLSHMVGPFEEATLYSTQREALQSYTRYSGRETPFKIHKVRITYRNKMETINE